MLRKRLTVIGLAGVLVLGSAAAAMAAADRPGPGSSQCPSAQCTGERTSIRVQNQGAETQLQSQIRTEAETGQGPGEQVTTRARATDGTGAQAQTRVRTRVEDGSGDRVRTQVRTQLQDGDCDGTCPAGSVADGRQSGDGEQERLRAQDQDGSCDGAAARQRGPAGG